MPEIGHDALLNRIKMPNNGGAVPKISLKWTRLSVTQNKMETLIIILADNQMEWVGRMNALRSAVTETVNAEVIFV